jgi:hypothetical protein
MMAKMKSVEGAGQVEVLHPALAEAEPGDAAEAERQQRLDRVVAGAERIAERVEEGLDARQLVARGADHEPGAAPTAPPAIS